MIASKRLTSSKTIILVDVSHEVMNTPTYEDAKRTCENICGSLYFPSTLKENNEVDSFLAAQKGFAYLDIWIRLVFKMMLRACYLI